MDDRDGLRKFIRKNKYGYRAIMALMIQRPLDDHEWVHHKDGDHYNNLPGNLQLIAWWEHGELHRELNKKLKEENAPKPRFRINLKERLSGYIPGRCWSRAGAKKQAKRYWRAKEIYQSFGG